MCSLFSSWAAFRIPDPANGFLNQSVATFEAAGVIDARTTHV